MANEFKVKNGIIVNTSTNTQAKLAYDETHYTTLNVDANGDLTIDPTGSDVIVDGYTTATGFKIPGGTSSQYLRADGTTGAGGTGGASELGPDIQRCGFLNQTETTISFDGTNTFTLGDAGSGWSYYMDGEKYSITGNKTVTLAGSPPAAKGRYFITITNNGSGTLSSSTTVWNLLDSTVLPVAIVNWDNALTPKYWLADERHSCLIDRRDHYLQHHSHGTLCLQAGALAGYTLNTSSDAANTFSIGETHIADEDILLTLSALTDPNGSSADYVIFYRNASNVWSWKSSIVPFSYTTSSYIEWDNAGTLTTGITNKWYNSYILFTDYAGAARFIIVSGRGEFSSLSNAQAEDPSLFDWTGLGISEYVIAYQLTWKSATADGNTGKARLIAEPKRINISSVSATDIGGAVGIDVSDDYTDGSYYPIWSKASSGNITDVYTSSGSLTYNPSTSNLALKGTVNAYGTLLGVLFEDETATCQDVDVSLLDTPLTAPSIIKGTSSIVTSYLKNNDPTFDSKLYGMYNKTIIDTTGGNSNNNGYVCGLFSGAEINSSDATYNKLYEGVGGHNYIQVENTADVQIATGVKSSVVAASGGNIETGYLFKGSFGVTMGGTIPQRYGIFIDSACNSYLYGLQIGGSVPTNTGVQGLGVGTASTGSGNIDASGTITNIKEWSATTGSAGIYLNGTTGNRIDFASVGSAAPSIPTRSAGCKVMYLNDTTNGDYATGIESGYVWNSIPSTGTGFKWYKGSSATATLTGEGYLTLNGTAPGIKVTNATSTVKTTNTFENTGSSGSSFDIRSHGSGYSETVFGSNVSGDTALITTAGDLLVGTYPARRLILGTNNTTRMLFDGSSGNSYLYGNTNTEKLIVSNIFYNETGTSLDVSTTLDNDPLTGNAIIKGTSSVVTSYLQNNSVNYETTIYASYNKVNIDATAGNSNLNNGRLTGTLSLAEVNSSGATFNNQSIATGSESVVAVYNESNVTNCYGVSSSVISGSGGAITNGYLFKGSIDSFGGGVITNKYGLYIDDACNSWLAGSLQLGGDGGGLLGTGAGGLGVGTNPTGTGKIDATGTITNTATYSASSGAANLYLNSTTGNRIDFNQNGVAAPAFTTRSAGTKILLFPDISETRTDYAIGIASNALWSSVSDSTKTFKWYAGTTEVVSLTGGGHFSCTSGITSNTRSYFYGNQTATLLTATSNLGGIECQSASSSAAAFMCFHRPFAYAAYFGIDTDNNFAVGGWSAGAALGLMKVGSFGVGTAASGVTGEIRATNNITGYYSDKRLKNIISTIPDALDKVCSLSGYYYTENKKAKELGYTNDRVQIGLVTQEVEKVLPEIVTDAPIGHGYKTLWYEKMVPVLVEAIKEQQGIIEKQDERISRMESLLERLDNGSNRII